MDSKFLRKSLRLWLEELTKLQTELEKLNTLENQTLLLQYPIIDKCWQHPQSHLMVRTFELLESTRKTMVKVVGALPPERKTKIVKFVEPKPPKKEKTLDEQAKPKKKAGRSGISSPAAPKGNRKAGSEGGDPGHGIKQPSEPLERKVRKVRSDKGRSRGSNS